MKYLKSKELRTILHSKRANLYYLEFCRILLNGGRVEYVTDSGKEMLYWNIPIANTTVIILGVGTSITQAAVRELSKAGVLIGFCGTDGTPLYSGEENITWFQSQSEYRPTEYMQKWMKIWLDEVVRFEAAKELQLQRIENTKKIWQSEKLVKNGFICEPCSINLFFEEYKNNIKNCTTQTSLFLVEANATKNLYKKALSITGEKGFKRIKNNNPTDTVNTLLTHGNYLTYGLGATTAWCLGISFSLSLLHGKTRKGGLVFDIADLFKDGIILPQAFISASHGDSIMEFRKKCVDIFIEEEVIDGMIDACKNIIEKFTE